MHRFIQTNHDDDVLSPRNFQCKQGSFSDLHHVFDDRFIRGFCAWVDVDAEAHQRVFDLNLGADRGFIQRQHAVECRMIADDDAV